MLVNQFVTSGCADDSERGSKLLPMLVNQSVTYDTELYPRCFLCVLCVSVVVLLLGEEAAAGAGSIFEA